MIKRKKKLIDCKIGTAIVIIDQGDGGDASGTITRLMAKPNTHNEYYRALTEGSGSTSINGKQCYNYTPKYVRKASLGEAMFLRSQEKKHGKKITTIFAFKQKRAK